MHCFTRFIIRTKYRVAHIQTHTHTIASLLRLCMMNIKWTKALSFHPRHINMWFLCRMSILECSTLIIFYLGCSIHIFRLLPKTTQNRYLCALHRNNKSKQIDRCPQILHTKRNGNLGDFLRFTFIFALQQLNITPHAPQSEMVELHHTSLLKANWPPLNWLVCLSHCAGYPGSEIVSNCFLSTRIMTISDRRVKSSYDHLHFQSLRELQAAFSQIMGDCV